MTKEQLNALEAWIVAIIREEDCASNIEDVVYRVRMREAVEIALRQPTQSDALRDAIIEECAMKVRECWLDGESYSEVEDLVRALKEQSK